MALVKVSNFLNEIYFCLDKFTLLSSYELFGQFEPIFFYPVGHSLVTRIDYKLLPAGAGFFDAFFGSFCNGYVAAKRREKEIAWASEDYINVTSAVLYFTYFHNLKVLG